MIRVDKVLCNDYFYFIDTYTQWLSSKYYVEPADGLGTSSPLSYPTYVKWLTFGYVGTRFAFGMCLKYGATVIS